jgi:hypothetical protein
MTPAEKRTARKQRTTPDAEQLETGIFEMIEANEELARMMKDVIALYDRLANDGIFIRRPEVLQAEAVEVKNDFHNVELVVRIICEKCRLQLAQCACVNHVEKTIGAWRRAVRFQDFGVDSHGTEGKGG